MRNMERKILRYWLWRLIFLLRIFISMLQSIYYSLSVLGSAQYIYCLMWTVNNGTEWTFHGKNIFSFECRRASCSNISSNCIMLHVYNINQKFATNINMSRTNSKFWIRNGTKDDCIYYWDPNYREHWKCVTKLLYTKNHQLFIFTSFIRSVFEHLPVSIICSPPYRTNYYEFIHGIID